MKNRRGDLQRTDTELTLVKHLQEDSFSTSDGSLSSESDSNNVSCDLQADASQFSRRSASAETLDSLLDAEEPLMSQCRRHRTLPVNELTRNIPVKSGQYPRDMPAGSRSGSTSYHSGSTPCLTRRCLVILAGISLSFSALVACLTAFCVVHILVPIYHEATFTEGDYQNCFECDWLGGDNRTHRRDQPICSGDHPQAQVYCAQNSGQMSAFFQNMLDKRKSSPVTPPAKTNKFRVGPVSAHNKLRANTGNDWSSTLEDGLQLVFRTRSSSVDAGHYNLVTRTNGSYVIQVTGLYLLYASVTVKSKSDACKRASNKTFRMAIMRRAAGSSPILSVASVLSSAEHKCCHTCNFVESERHSLHTGGLFHLNETDEVFVYVKGAAFILSEGEESHFGAILYRAAGS